MKIYTMDGDFITEPEILNEGKDFFRKMTTSTVEKKICEILLQNPHNNIVKIYAVGKDYIDMELLDTDMDNESMSNIKNVMMELKTYLQNLGIMYIDWKLDNIGISKDKQFKLFDFNASGLIDIETGEWKRRPPMWWSHARAIENGMETPVNIDDFAFDLEFQKQNT
jgi:serine/threonine protein kinase